MPLLAIILASATLLLIAAIAASEAGHDPYVGRYDD